MQYHKKVSEYKVVALTGMAAGWPVGLLGETSLTPAGTRPLSGWFGTGQVIKKIR